VYTADLVLRPRSGHDGAVETAARSRPSATADLYGRLAEAARPRTGPTTTLTATVETTDESAASSLLTVLSARATAPPHGPTTLETAAVETSDEDCRMQLIVDVP
jgi:hypothetical protein